MKVAIDLDGTIDSDPVMFRKLMVALRERGDKVIVLTGCHNCPVTEADKTAKKVKLAGLGLAGCYNKLKVVPNPPAKAKAEYCAKHDVALLIDNSMMNAQLAPAGTTVLVPWKTLSN
jgi:hypothetical protein